MDISLAFKLLFHIPTSSIVPLKNVPEFLSFLVPIYKRPDGVFIVAAVWLNIVNALPSP